MKKGNYRTFMKKENNRPNNYIPKKLFPPQAELKIDAPIFIEDDSNLDLAEGTLKFLLSPRLLALLFCFGN